VRSYASGYVRGEMIAAVICEKMGWTYHDYVAQPNWFVQLLIEKLAIDAKKEREAAKSKR
jgi:hypothetical protein